jgi:hypothetical protein
VAEFLNKQLAAAVGFYRMTNLSEVQRIALEYPESKHSKLTYEVYFQKAVKYLLQG